MIDWNYFKSVRRLKVDEWFSKCDITSYIKLVSVLQDLGVKPPPECDVEHLFLEKNDVLLTTPSTQEEIHTCSSEVEVEVETKVEVEAQNTDNAAKSPVKKRGKTRRKEPIISDEHTS